MIGTLFVIATPIGNLNDITKRSKETLAKVHAVICEDTRVTGKLLSHLEIKQKLISYTSHATEKKHKAIIDLLEDGKDLALVTDAGTPAISDPGFLIVKEVHEAFGSEARIMTVPGPSAVIAALSISGIPASEFVFLGFLPHKKGRETLFKEIAESKRTMVFYESPHRILKTMEKLADILPKSRTMAIARELTKLYEEVIRGNAEECKAVLKQNEEKVRGEFVVIIEGK